MNKVTLYGNLTRDPEVRYSLSATPVAVARYGLAVRRRFKGSDGVETDFFNLVAFGKAGEFAEKYLKKGMPILIQGRLVQNTWEDNGQKRQSIEVVVEEHYFTHGSEKQGASPTNQAKGNTPSQDAFAPVPGFTPTMEDDDDLPF